MRHQPDEQNGWGVQDWQEPPRQQRDWKKALLVLGLGTLSWVATYVGMLELIQSNMGELSIAHKVIIGFSVAMLMTMIIWLLDQMFAPLPFVTKMAYVAGYLFLTLISVGFGFGFYWKVLESRSEASRSAESAVTQVKNALHGASARLDQLQTTFDQLTQISTAKAVEEREKGTTCPNSRPGDGPRRRLRDADAARFAFASQFIKGRAGKSKADMKSLDIDMKKIASADPSTFDPKTGTRNKFLQALTRRLELTATGFNAFRTDPQLRQIRTELAERAAKTEFPMSNGRTFLCPDPQLQSALRGVVRAIDQLPELGKPQIATVEGAQAVVEAFRRLTATFYGVLTFKLPPSADELRALQQKAVQSVDNAAKRQAEIKVGEGGLSKRDYIPLAIAVFVDLCLLLVSIGRPMNRLNGLIPKMREAERGPVYQILSRFDDIHRDQKIREKFEVFRHVVFDFNGDYYVAVPLDAPRNRNPDEVEALQQEAHLLGNLFASFEKEKIFSRVYNPLLTRKTITKKLRRQGSKFADSEAFRTYRFRDGAWSEIILGAVMGASRGVLERRREEVVEQGHSISMPADQSEPAPKAEEVRQALDESLRRNAAEGAPYTPRPVDPVMRQKYGRYAETMNELPEDNDTAETIDTAPRWPYRKPEPAAKEADVDVHVAANSNTSPSQAPLSPPANVIPMPMQRAAANDWSEPVASRGQTPGLVAAPASLNETPNVLAEPPGPLAGEEGATQSINVRLTERTADFTVPVTDAELPQRIMQTVGQAEAAQLSMDLSKSAQPAQRIVENNPEIAPEHTPAGDKPPIILLGASPETEVADDFEEAEEILPEEDTDDPMLRVAHKFAAHRTPAE